jgi:G3E family GTPase
MNQSNAPSKIPTIIISGFLGAGKTTLLNRILTAAHGKRIAIIVNEFGDVGIDHHLLISPGMRVMQMNNGCICCTVRTDLIAGFLELLEIRSQFDAVIIETTGLAEPGPIAQSLYFDDRISDAFSLEGIVTLVDAKHLSGQLRESGEVAEQIAFADLIVLNKIDLISTEELGEIEHAIRDLNGLAEIVPARNSQIEIERVFQLRSIGLSSRAAQMTVGAHGHDHSDHHHHGHHHHHKHLQGIETISIVEAGDVDGLRLSMWFRGLMAKSGANLMRMKGILSIWGDPDRFVFQGVQLEFEGRPDGRWQDGEDRVNRLVFIGKKLDRQLIEQGFRECLAGANQPERATSDPFGRSNVEISSQALDQIRYWMRQNFNFPPEVPILIKEVPCMKPSCPPIETAIVALLKNEPPRLFKVQHMINNISFDHIYDLMENPMPCC